jgi:hypothetical protein
MYGQFCTSESLIMVFVQHNIYNSFQSVDVVTRMPSLIYSGFTEAAISLTSAIHSVVFLIAHKKNPIFRFIYCFEYFFHGFGEGFFAGRFSVESRHQY